MKERPPPVPYATLCGNPLLRWEPPARDLDHRYGSPRKEESAGMQHRSDCEGPQRVIHRFAAKTTSHTNTAEVRELYRVCAQNASPRRRLPTDTELDPVSAPWYRLAMTNATVRIDSERDFHDAQARERAVRFRDAAHLRFADSAYLDHEPWIRPAIAALGDLEGRTILDYGCGHGMSSVVLARRGAVVHGFDLSQSYVDEAVKRAAVNEVDGVFQTADAHHLPYDTDTFDAVWGNAILHHLELDRAAREIARVLKPGGVAVFCEPWGGNPLIEFARKRLPYPGKDRTPDERPLRPDDLAILQTHFALEVHGHQLFGIVRRLWTRESRTGGPLDRFDAAFLRRWPKLQRFSRYAVLVLRKG
jgi:SAM-dependent methyltransferase